MSKNFIQKKKKKKILLDFGFLTSTNDKGCMDAIMKEPQQQHKMLFAEDLIFVFHCHVRTTQF